MPQFVVGVFEPDGFQQQRSQSIRHKILGSVTREVGVDLDAGTEFAMVLLESRREVAGPYLATAQPLRSKGHGLA